MKAAMLALKGVAVAVVATCLCSCGNNDEDSTPDIVGNWNLVSSTYGGHTDTPQQMGISFVVYVNANGTYSTVFVDASGTYTENGSWSVNGNQLTTASTGENPMVETYSVSANILTITGTEDGLIYVDVYNRF